MRARARVSAAVLLAAIVVSGALLAGSPAVAQTDTPAGTQPGTPSLVLAGQSAWIAPGADFAMRLSATNVPPGAQVALTLHDPLTSRTAFDASVGGGSLPPTRGRQTFAFDQLPVDPTTGQRLLATPTTGLGGSGVFPLEVDLRSASDESLARFVTHVVVAPVGAEGALDVGQPLSVAWVWPLQAPPAFLGGLSVNRTTLRSLALDGRLGRQAVQLALDTDVPMTLAPSPETLEAWDALGKSSQELSAGAAAMKSAATSGHHQVLAGPYVPLDIPSLVRGDLQDVVTTTDTRAGELTRGVATLEQVLGVHVDPSTALPGPLDSAALGILQGASVRQLVVHGNALTPANEKYTPAHPFKLQSAAGDQASAATVVATDDGLEQFLSGSEPPALRAAHLLAGLSLIAGEQPSVARGVAIANPADWDADPTFTSAVISGLRQNPLLRATTVQGLLESVPVATAADGAAPVYRQLAAYSPPAAPVTAAEYAKGVHDRDAIAQLQKSAQQVANADRALASSVAAVWANPAGRVEARQVLQSIGTSVRDYLKQVEVQPPSTITITSSKAEIPISFRNNSDDDIAVHLKLESNRLLFPGGAEQDVLLPRRHNTTVRVAVETRGSGTAPVTMTVTTPGGLRIGDPTVIKVRSSFVSGVGIFLTVAAIVFLAVWWGWDIHRRRKKRSREAHPTYRLAPPSGQPA